VCYYIDLTLNKTSENIIQRCVSLPIDKTSIDSIHNGDSDSSLKVPFQKA